MTNLNEGEKYDLVIIGGLGHVGLPLGVVFAKKGLKTVLFDIDPDKSLIVKSGKFPFIEYDAEEILKEVISNGSLHISEDKEIISKSKAIIICIGTPIDEYLNPKTREFLEVIETFKPHIREDQLIVIRSTVYPNTCQQISKLLGEGKSWKIAYCPERIIQGYAVRELSQLPQIISGLNENSINEAENLFKLISPKIIKTSLKEAELIKLFSNSWRYIQFAVTNQFYMISRRFGVDYEKVRHGLTEGYGRAANLPCAGFAAGPCLLKDTIQLASFDTSNFLLGHAAMMVNEGLPNFLVEDLKKRIGDLNNKKIGILGMAFKADIDDVRDSLSFKLGKILRFNGADVYYSDEFAKNPDFISKEELINKCESIIIGVPHTAYKEIVFPKSVIEIIDLWGISKINNDI